MTPFNAREAAHDAARVASDEGSCNVLSCAFAGYEGRNVVCGIYCDEQTAALQRAYDAGRADGLDSKQASIVEAARLLAAARCPAWMVFGGPTDENKARLKTWNADRDSWLARERTTPKEPTP